MIMRKLSILCLASTAAVLGACSSGNAPASPASTSANASSTPSLIGNVIDSALDKASTELTTKNITVSNDDNGAPKAEITPQGDFLIGGKPVPLTPAQRTRVLAYRQQIIGIGRQGIVIGKQGATLGMRAAGTALAGVLSGESDQKIQQSVKAQTAGIQQAAIKICDRLPALMTSQQKLAADVPAFKPYATMTQKDIDDCRKGSWNDDND